MMSKHGLMTKVNEKKKKILFIQYRFNRLGNTLLAPTLLSVRKKTSSSDVISTDETPVSADEEEEDPSVTNLEQDEVETETDTPRKKI